MTEDFTELQVLQAIGAELKQQTAHLATIKVVLVLFLLAAIVGAVAVALQA